MVRIGLVKKPPAVGLFFYGWVWFFLVLFFVHVWKVSYLDNVFQHLILIEDTQAEQGLETVGMFFLGRGFEHHLLSLIFPQRTGLWRSKKWDGG